MTKQLETMYLLYDLGWYLFVRAEPFTEQELRAMALELSESCEEELSDLGITDLSSILIAPMDVIETVLILSMGYEILEVSLLQEAMENE